MRKERDITKTHLIQNKQGRWSFRKSELCEQIGMKFAFGYVSTVRDGNLTTYFGKVRLSNHLYFFSLTEGSRNSKTWREAQIVRKY